MRSCVVLFLLLTVGLSAKAQLQGADNHLTDSLKQNLANAKTPTEKVRWLGELADFYMGADRVQSDKYAAEQATVAELSRDRMLMVKALFTNAQRHLKMSGRQDNLNTGIVYAQKALDLSKESELEEYEAWSYLLLAQGARKNSENDKALNYCNLASSIASFSSNDSLKILSFQATGHTYLNKNEKKLAFRNYLLATNLAEDIKSYELQKGCFYIMSSFYQGIDDLEKAKDYMYKVLALANRYHKPYDRLNAYNSLGRMYASGKQAKQDTMSLYFYNQSLALADTLNFELIKLNTYGNMLESYVQMGKIKEAKALFDSTPQLRRYFKQSGQEYYLDQAYGMAHTELGDLDSAEFYLNRAEIAFEQNASMVSLHGFYMNKAHFYKRKNDYKSSLLYTLKAKKIADKSDNIRLIRWDAGELDSIYQKLGDFKNAYAYQREYQKANDSLDILSAEKDVLRMQVVDENRRREKEEVAEAEATRERHNIQYMGITAAIAGVFIVLVMLGIFSVSAGTIRIIGFFAFIFLFEFIILLADNKIHHWTHGEPWKVLLIKIGLISILLPLHHFTEKKVVHYITSRKLFELNKDSILAKFKKKEEAPAADQR